MRIAALESAIVTASARIFAARARQRSMSLVLPVLGTTYPPRVPLRNRVELLQVAAFDCRANISESRGNDGLLHGMVARQVAVYPSKLSGGSGRQCWERRDDYKAAICFGFNSLTGRARWIRVLSGQSVA
jgi:hypothetical protein